MTADQNRQMTITYNNNNLPATVTVKGNKIDYVYDANGSLMRRKVTNGGVVTTYHYFGDIVYKQSSSSLSLGYITTSQGRIVSATDNSHRYEYYIKDHLGNVRVTFNENGPLQETSYYPFGKVLESKIYSGQEKDNHLFNGKEQQDEIPGFGFYDYGARLYDPALARWHSVDPLAGKYANYSPYNFCVGNPLRFVDPDGRKVRFANGSSAEFKTAFTQAVQHLNNHGAGGMLAELEKSDKVYYISNIGFDDPKGSRFNFKKETIYWNPNGGILTNNGYELSPTSVLNHEIDHALQYDKNPQQFHKDRKTEDSQYTNKEEQRVITGSEQNTAKKLGEINDEEVTREDHRGQLYETSGPTSTEWKNEIVITP